MAYHLSSMPQFGPFLADFSLKNGVFQCFLEVMRSTLACEHDNRFKIYFSKDYMICSKNLNFYDFLTIHGQSMAYHLSSMPQFGPFLADISLKTVFFGGDAVYTIL